MGTVREPQQGVLSPRELEVLTLIADGVSNRAAAAKLYLSEASNKTHLLHIYEKLGVRDRAAAVGEAFRRRLLTRCGQARIRRRAARPGSRSRA